MEAPPPVPVPAPESPHVSTCRNCGTESTGKFCPECGQKTIIRRRTLWFVVADFFAHSFAFDGRFWATIIPLVTKPGWVTEQNLNERWVSFLPALRMFLVISLIFFFVLSSTLPAVIEEGAIFSVNGETVGEGDLPTEEMRIFSDNWIPTRWANDLFASKLEIINQMEPGVRDYALYRGAVNSIPMTLLLAIPLFAFGLKILQFLRRRYFFDHFVFATHFYSIWLLALIPSLILQEAWIWIAGHAIYLPIYLFLAMKRVYRQHWFPTIAKMILLGIWQIFSIALLALTVVLSAVLHV